LCFFPVSENGENGLGDEGADGGSAPRMFGLEPPMITDIKVTKKKTDESAECMKNGQVLDCFSIAYSVFG